MVRRSPSIRSFEPTQLASEIVGVTLARAQARETQWLATLLQEVADAMVATFFTRMASFMGTEGSMMSPMGYTSQAVKYRTGSDGRGRDRFNYTSRRIADPAAGVGLDGVRAVGGEPWKPLSQRYVQYKGTDKFWVFKNARNALRRDLKLKSNRRVGLVDRRRPGARVLGSPLKEWIARRDALTVLGSTQIASGTPGYFVRTSGSASTDAQPLRFESLEGDAEGRERRVRKRIPIVFKIFPKVMDFAKPETTLLRQSGGKAQVTKLLGRTEWHRPLMRPLLAYYQQVLLRQAWDDAVSQSGFSTAAASTSFTRQAVNVTAENNARVRAAKNLRRQQAKAERRI